MESRSSRMILSPAHHRLCIYMYPVWTEKYYFVDVFSIKKTQFYITSLHVVVVLPEGKYIFHSWKCYSVLRAMLGKDTMQNFLDFTKHNLAKTSWVAGGGGSSHRKINKDKCSLPQLLELDQREEIRETLCCNNVHLLVHIGFKFLR